MLHVEASTTVRAPKETVSAVYTDYRNWPALFPTISGVRLLGHDGPKLILEVDHAEGKVRNELLVRPPDELDLWEVKRRYDARFRNRFDAVPGGTRFTVSGDIRLKGWARLLQPLLGGHVRRQMRRFQLQPVQAEAEARARRAGGATGSRGPDLPTADTTSFPGSDQPVPAAGSNRQARDRTLRRRGRLP